MLDPEALLRRLAGAEVQHVIVGGVAMGLLEREAVIVDWHGITLRVCSLAHLRAMKKAAGRPQDLEDLADLEIANG
ncbi:MAG: hypothetical protein WBP81_31480 [Solirubrobacteraceae bacterium]